MRVARFMLDTNILLQCRDLRELPWADLTDAEEVELYPAPTALHEVDKFKTAGDRRSDRARKVSARMRKVVLDPGEQLELNPRAPRLVLRLPPELTEAALDLIARQPTPDYRIVEETCALSVMLDGLVLLTADTGPSLRAKQRGLRFELVGDDWLLPPESDAKDRRIATLETKLAALSSGGPVIEATLGAPNGADLKRLEISDYGQLSPFTRDALVEVLTGQILIDAERAVTEDLHGGFELVKSSTRELQDYRDQVETWREEVRESLPLVSPHAQIASRLHPFQLRIANKGGHPAEHVRVTIEARGYVILASANASARYWDADEEYLLDARMGPPHLEIPAAPDPPKQARPHFPPTTMTPRASRYAFRRTSKDRGDEAEAAIVFECEDLRHGDDGQTLYFSAFLGGASTEGEINVTITAANLPAPMTIKVETDCVEVRGDIDGVAANMVKLYTSGVRLNRCRG
jgi:hypothetical protein